MRPGPAVALPLFFTGQKYGMDKFAGIDIGSRSIELVVLTDGSPTYAAKVPTTFDPMAQCGTLLSGLDFEKIVATGYGRRLFLDSFKGPPVSAITEIQAYALGARWLFPDARTVLDIGGQDTKVISVAPDGRVARFEMNDRCAAGTGKFLEFMATALQIPLESFGDYALRSNRRIQINSMCTVFAESEATSLMARGERPENIALGLHLSVVQRTMAMLGKVGATHPLVFAGGVAHNPCIVRMLVEQLGLPLSIPEDPDSVGALGAALYGRNSGRQG